MNARKIIVPALFVALSVSLMSGFLTAAQNPGQKSPQVFIPKEVKADIQEGLDSRQGRQDFPVTIFKSLYLPARDIFNTIFFMNISNADLGFAAAAGPAETPPGQTGPQETPFQEAPSEMKAAFNVFLQFNQLDKNGVPKIFREVYAPTTITLPAADAEKQDLYTIGYPLPAGDYVVAIAVTSPDLQKVAIAYHEFSLPDPSQFAKTLDTTPIFFVKQIDQKETADTQTLLHRGYFTVGVFEIVPNLEKVFSAGENLDILFFIFGAQPNASQQYEIEIDFEVKKEEEMQIQFTPQTYANPMISQPLPMKQTVKIKKGEEERIEQRDLPPGSYTLVITMTDKVSQNTGVKTIDFEVK